MLREIIERPVSVVIATLVLVTIGVFSLLRLPVSLLPTLERPRLQVTVRDADRSREELLERVVEPLERRFLSLAGVVEVASTVEDGRCRLTLETEWQTDVDRLRIDAERRLAEVSGLSGDPAAASFQRRPRARQRFESTSRKGSNGSSRRAARNASSSIMTWRRAASVSSVPKLPRTTSAKPSQASADEIPLYSLAMTDWRTCPAVERTPGRVSGAWVFRGTRVPVRALFENLEDGASVDDFLEWFPGVARAQVEAALGRFTA